MLFVVAISDRRVDDVRELSDATPEVWFYEVEADDARAAIDPALDKWHAEVGNRPAVSLIVRPVEEA